MGTGLSLVVDHRLMKQWVIESILLNYLMIQPVIYNWCNKGCGVYCEMCVCVCVCDVHIFSFTGLVRSVQDRVFNVHIQNKLFMGTGTLSGTGKKKRKRR